MLRRPLPATSAEAQQLAAYLVRKNRDRYGDARMEVSTETEAQESVETPVRFKDPETGEEFGFPEKTPLADMTEGQRTEYWRHKAQKHEKVSRNRGDYDQIKSQLEALQQASLTADEKAVEDAKKAAADEARADERKVWAGRTVQAELRAALRDVGVQADKIETILEPINTQNFLTDAGEVATDKVTAYASGFSGASKQQWPDMGQGNRGGGTSAKESGSDLYDRYYGKKKTTNTTQKEG